MASASDWRRRPSEPPVGALRPGHQRHPGAGHDPAVHHRHPVRDVNGVEQRVGVAPARPAGRAAGRIAGAGGERHQPLLQPLAHPGRGGRGAGRRHPQSHAAGPAAGTDTRRGGHRRPRPGPSRARARQPGVARRGRVVQPHGRAAGAGRDVAPPTAGRRGPRTAQPTPRPARQLAGHLRRRLPAQSGRGVAPAGSDRPPDAAGQRPARTGPGRGAPVAARPAAGRPGRAGEG